MKKYLIDTDILIAHLRNQKSNELQIDFVEESIISYFSAGELLQGVRDAKERKVIRAFLQAFSIDWGSEVIHRKALDLLATYAPSDGLHMSDAIIAATALELKLRLVTKNTKHFRCIKALPVSARW